MSHQQNQEFHFWKLVESQIRSGLSTLDSNLLSENDKTRLANAYCLWALCIKDLYGDEYPRECSDAALSSWIRRLAGADPSWVKDQLDACLTTIRLWQPHMGSVGLRSFKRYARDNGCDLTSVVFDPIRRGLYHYAKSHSGFRKLNTVLQFTSRLTLKEVDWIEQAALDDYVAFEARLESLTYPSDILGELRELALADSMQFERSSMPCHGNGATAEVRRNEGIEKKFNNFFLTPRLQHFMNASPHIGHPLIPPVSDAVSIAKVQFVPKGLKKKRTICMEPTLNQFLQKSLEGDLKLLFKRSPHMRIDLNDQEHNRSLCMRGSKYLDYGTIDLSSASDSVTDQLVQAVFSGTSIGKLLFLLRTPYCQLPDGQVIKMRKFVPMGSALCFPIECWIFSLIIRLAQKRVGVYSYFRVYGDDLVVHESCFTEVVNILTSLHFEVNQEKTFYPGSCFTESCGIECYNGEDVSPCRLSRFYDIVGLKDPLNHTAVEGMVDTVNRLWSYNLFSTRKYLLRTVLEIYPELPFSECADLGIVSYAPTHYRHKKRYNLALQRQEIRVDMLYTRVTKGSDDIRYIATLEALSTTDRKTLLSPEDRIEIRVGPTLVKRKLRYVPLNLCG